MRARSTRCRERLREGADLVIDGGELPGTPSTVVDLRDYEERRWHVLREGALRGARPWASELARLPAQLGAVIARTPAAPPLRAWC